MTVTTDTTEAVSMNQEALEIQSIQSQPEAERMVSIELPTLESHSSSESLLRQAIDIGRKGGRVDATQHPWTRTPGALRSVVFDPNPLYEACDYLRGQVLYLAFDKKGRADLIERLHQERGEAYQELALLTRQVTALEAEALINPQLIPRANKARSRLQHFLERQAVRLARGEALR